MQANLPTMLLMILVTSGAMAAAVLLVAVGKSSRDGLAWWGCGLLLNTLAYLFFASVKPGQQGWPVVLGNTLESAALAAALHAVALFQNLVLRRRWFWVPVFAVAALSGAFAQQANWRVPFVELVIACQLATVAWVAGVSSERRPARRMERGRLLLSGGMALLALIYLRRVVVAFMGNAAAVDLQSPHWSQTVSYMLGLVGVLFSTLGYVLMHKEHAEKLYRGLSTQDALTGIANRRLFDEQVSRYWADYQQSGRVFAMFLADIDHFKLYNDHYGHQAGDSCLVQVARALAGNLREGEYFAGRWGGEEFTMLIAPACAETLDRMAERLVQVVRQLGLQHLHRPDGLGVVTISVGGTLSSSPSVGSLKELLARVDAMLYQAKQQGRNRYCVNL